MTENNHHRQLWLIQLGTVALLALFLGLGIWQIERGNFKRQLKAAVNDTTVTEQLYLPLDNPTAWRGKTIRIYGHYWSEKQFLLDNQVRDQLSGYSVLTPFYIQQFSSWVLVDRGWIAPQQGREQLPAVGVNEQDRTISGRIYVPFQSAFSLGGIAEGEDSGWPRRIQYVDYEQLAARLGVQLQSFTLRLDSQQPFGYRRDWLDTQLPASKHYAYAFQWFALAAAIVVLWWIYVARPKISKNE